ncbi:MULTISPECIES: hypothetical protein [unclassified Hahella]|uniref:hypothetical protein n=1 Tax=unclassified Hahella TaxID=2624107 RepID=UPI001C1EC35F|nr:MULTISPECIES: hypothetical protein [unclassified Hahella]MBU6954017.1 hypothetical protein [Hahella sp. HN01]MDG9667749.1 hypothetical protein [Hahella sp. CR1]
MKIGIVCLALLLWGDIARADAQDDEWVAKMDAIANQVCVDIPEECVVIYSAYGEDAKGMPVNNLHEVAVEGQVIVVQPHDAFWGEGTGYQSKPLQNPTWLDLAKSANQMIHTTGDYHHVYLEDFEIVGTKDGVSYIQLLMGS